MLKRGTSGIFLLLLSKKAPYVTDVSRALETPLCHGGKGAVFLIYPLSYVPAQSLEQRRVSVGQLLYFYMCAGFLAQKQ